MELDANTRCYCLRRVNPFLGVVAVVETRDGRALTLDGRHWQIQVLARPRSGPWSRDQEPGAARYFNFGAWSPTAGLARVPLNPALDVESSLAASTALIAQVRLAAPNLPFAPAAELEQWLLDEDMRPLALIGTALIGDDTALAGREQHAAWNAGGRGDTRPFCSPTLTAQGIPERDDSGRRPHVETLERMIANAAGARRHTQWFRRDGAYALGLEQPAASGLSGRRLAQADFPPLTINTQWTHTATGRLVGEYIAWLSPYLLALPGLDEATRHDLEREAVRHATLVDAIWRLYPRVIDDRLLKQARVEASLRRAAA